jgi:hypothetical protein
MKIYKNSNNTKELNVLPLPTGVLLPLVLFENPSNTLASVELGAKCRRAESITNIVRNDQLGGL